ncbi:galactose mutarotase [Clostridium sp. CX1]|uniref:aldose epimerase family protein n=1 Tax=Clostridium sp. CX1 TaxID=2978346 RepID=UPI0021C07467|nr:aldose epimerase family protein [Clostridium sp. CX1]MCT8975153.1 galactose mutarotase [Clostridium sp. CX1]
MKVTKKLFGEINWENVYEYTLKNDKGIEISCLDYGCVITKIVTPDRHGKYENIVLGFEDIESYREKSPYFGAVVGRVAGRIKGGEFELEGRTYTLANNDGKNHLHGGVKGFNDVIWEAEITEGEDEIKIEFSYTSLDGEEGYPGNLDVKVEYILNNNNEFIIQYKAETDKTTLFNPTNHSYFNLSGNLKRDVLEHSLKVDSSKFLEIDEELLPTGKVLEVSDTVFDFRKGRKIKEGVSSNYIQNKIVGQGYDHTFILNSNNSEILLWDEESGRKLVMNTDAPAVVLYTSNQLEEGMDLYGVSSRNYLGLCLETQIPPDAIHHESFPDCILRPEEIFISRTKYTFSLE